MPILPIQEAAARLGISVVAVRKRAQRGTLKSHKQDGVWYIEVDDGQPGGQPVGIPHVDIGADRETLALLRETITTLREQLSVKDQQIGDLIRQGERLQSLLGNEQETTQRLLAVGAPKPPTSATEPQAHTAEDEMHHRDTKTAHRATQQRQMGLWQRILRAVRSD